MNLDETLEALRKKHEATARYFVYCSRRHLSDRVIVRHKTWDEATQIAERLQARHDLRHPNSTSWTKRLYIRELESSLSINQTYEPKMKISIERKALVNALAIVKPAACSIANMPVLANVAVGAFENSVDFTCTDMAHYIRVKVDAKITGKSDKDKDFTVRASLFTELVKSFTGETVDMEPFKNSVRVTCGQSKYNLGTLDIEEFPATPRVNPISEVKLLQPTLRTLLSATAYASNTAEDSRPVLCGSLFQVNGNLTTAGCDGRRLATMRGELEEKGKAAEVIVPRKVISQLLPLLDTDEKAKVNLAIGEKMVQFRFGDVSIISKIIDGKYPDYTKIIPKLEGEGIPIGRADLLNALRRVNFLSDECVLEFHAMTLTISAESNHKDIPGDAQESLLIPKSPELTAKFKTDFLIEALDAVDDDEVLFFGQPKAPGVFKVKSKPWLSVTAPINDKVKTAPKPADKPAEKQPEPAKK